MSRRLAMLARDEAETIPVLAAALAGQIDSWVLLLDSRTTDATADIAFASFDVPGKVAEHEWTDFGTARNLLLSLAREGLDGYLLLLDPDMDFTGRIPEVLSDPVYSAAFRDGGTEWRMPIMVRDDVDCAYVGRTHEVLRLDVPLSDLDVVVNVTTRGTPERYERDVALLLEDAATSPRSAFYLAQSYRDLGWTDQALGAYLRRAQMVGWVEETYLALYEAARLMEALDVDLAETLYLRAHQYRPTRAEALYGLASLLNRTDRLVEAAKWADRGLALPPSPDRLFVNRWIEDEGLAAESATAHGY